MEILQRWLGGWIEKSGQLIMPNINVYAIVALLSLLALWRIDSLQNKITLEKNAHAITKNALIREQEMSKAWELSYEEAYNNAKTHRQATQACLEREVEARTAEQERESILQTTQERSRTNEERQQVIDDATRIRSINRLNRPL